MNDNSILTNLGDVMDWDASQVWMVHGRWNRSMVNDTLQHACRGVTVLANTIWKQIYPRAWDQPNATREQATNARHEQAQVQSGASKLRAQRYEQCSSTGWREQATNAKARASSSARGARASYERKSTSKLSAKNSGRKTNV